MSRSTTTAATPPTTVPSNGRRNAARIVTTPTRLSAVPVVSNVGAMTAVSTAAGIASKAAFARPSNWIRSAMKRPAIRVR
jgi:hypothetical protein